MTHIINNLREAEFEIELPCREIGSCIAILIHES
jgi:hypothetical protein